MKLKFYLEMERKRSKYSIEIKRSKYSIEINQFWKSQNIVFFI